MVLWRMQDLFVRVCGMKGLGRLGNPVFCGIIGVLFLVLFAVRVEGGPPVLPEAHGERRDPATAGIDEALDLEHLWEIAGQEEKIQLALRIAEDGVQSAAPLMLRCIDAKEQPWTPACITALVALDQVQIVPEIREKLRESLDVTVIVTAALALGHWRDRYSYSLLLGTMMHALGGSAGSLAALHAFLRINGPHSTSYLRWIMDTSPYSAVQAACAMNLVRRVDKRHRSHLFGAMKELMSRSLLLPGWTTEELATAEFCIEGFNQGERGGCRVLRDVVEVLGHEHLPFRAEKIRWVLQRIDRKCLDTWHPTWSPDVGDAIRQAGQETLVRPLSISQYALLLLEERVNSVGEEPIAGHICSDLSALGTRKEPGRFCSEEGPVETYWVLQRDLEEGSMERWSRNRQRRLLKRRKGRKAFPSSYSKNLPNLEQPDWFPKSVYITIDDGPRLSRLRLVLDVLDEFGVKATFFFIGHNILIRFLEYPILTRNTLQRLVEGGHAIGYHSMDHQTQVSTHIMNLEPEQIEDDIRVFHWVLTWVLQGAYPLSVGRTPGGMGMSYGNLREGFYLGGLRAPLGWNAGDDHWPPGSERSVVRFLARSYIKKQSRKPVTILLHETKNLHKELKVFLKEIHEHSHDVRTTKPAPRGSE
jgi:peptidoglycan/xylan/chitin deacetylase (PgdA/CDA1 family)